MGWGDEIMVTGQVRVTHERDPQQRRVRVLDRNKQARWHELWDGNRRMVRQGEAGDFQWVVNGPGARPYIAAKHAERWVWRDWAPDGVPVGELHLTGQERAFGAARAGRVILEPTVKFKASPNKDWGWMRWAKLAWLLQERYGVRITQVGPPDTRLLDGVDFVVTRSFREACAVISGAAACALPEGGLHHAAAALGTPAVVIFGGYIAPRYTGYATQVNLFTGGEACGMRTTCEHCRNAMARIPPESVAERLVDLISQRTGKHVPASGHLAA